MSFYPTNEKEEKERHNNQSSTGREKEREKKKSQLDKRIDKRKDFKKRRKKKEKSICIIDQKLRVDLSPLLN